MEAGAVRAAWEIVELGEKTWEVVVSDGVSVRETVDEPEVADGPAPEPEELPEAVQARLARTDERLAAVERRLGDLGRHEQRLDGLELAHAQTERRLEERDKALREEIEEIYRQAERRVADTDGRPRWRQRRLELKLARQERDRRTREAEQRLAERSEAFLATVEREGVAAKVNLRTARDETDRGLDQLTALIDRIDAAEERVRSAEDRASAAERRALGSH